MYYWISFNKNFYIFIVIYCISTYDEETSSFKFILSGQSVKFLL